MTTTIPTFPPATQSVGQVTPEPGSYGAISALNRAIDIPAAAEYVARLVNEGDTPFRARYLTSFYEIPVGGQMIVPWDVMVHFLGNPYATNTPNRMDRREYLKRLRVKYGAYDDDDAWEANYPRVGAYSVTTGERYCTIVDDPDGATLHSARTTMADQAALEGQIAAMKQQMEVLQQLAMQNAGGVVEPSSPAPPMPDVASFSTVTPPSVTLPPTQNPQGIFDTPPPSSVPLVPATGAVEDTP